MKKLLLLFTITLFFVITGCSHKYIPGITKNFYEVINESEVINENKKTTLFINSITLSDQKDLSEDYRNRLINELKSFYVFNDVLYNVSKQNISDYIALDIIITEELDLHYRANYVKGFLTGALFFLPAPLIGFGYDYEVEITYIFSKNNLKKQITTKSKRRLSKKLFSKEPIADLISFSNSDMRHQLKNQIRSNIDFFKKQ